MTDHEVLRSYIPTADYIQSLTCGNCEVLIHNLSKPENSVFYIVGNVTNRKPGAPLTRYAVHILEKKLYQDRDYVSGYMGRTNDGKVILRSSTMFIRNGRPKPIGLLCVNIDVTVLMDMGGQLERFIGLTRQHPGTQETFHPSPELFADEIVAEMENLYAKPIDQFSKAQKLAVVEKLYINGVFRIKGAVRTVAPHLGVSQKTLYRYISELEDKNPPCNR